MLRKILLSSLLILGTILIVKDLSFTSIIPESKVVYSELGVSFYENKTIDPPYSSIIRIMTNTGTCTGVVVDANYAFTAAHCINDGSIMVLDTARRAKIIYVKLAVLDKKRDVALLRGDFSQFQGTKVDFAGAFAHMQSSPPMMLSCGYPYDGDLLCTYSYAVGNSFFRIQGVGGFLQPGQSGGPVFDMNFNLIGINSAVSADRLLFGPLVGFDVEYGIGVAQ